MTVPRRYARNELPLLDETLSVPLCGKKRIRARRKFKPQGIILIVAIVMIALRTFLIALPSMDRSSIPIAQQLSLKKFSSLAYPLANAKLVALYFGASYCEDNRLLRDSFLRDERLLPQEGSLPWSSEKEKYPLAIVYISSDDVEGSSQWIHVNDKKERKYLKQKFRVGTAQEAKELKMEAKFPVPSLFVIDSESNGVMTPMGLVDLKEKGADALKEWLQFQTNIAGIDPSVWAASELFRDDDAAATQ
mmetsp:Transcript_8837/g.14696  ORF Transcript_8837/g.14696 Transcript_8837/m.14696 type:complete len:248 (-) Transcript_8837:47-790(-)|eukprot:CAMPEP_0119014158 /NCGR_PEP_ID=MMETSP1176-20130426/9385_1 /TAXON_ID=265551 /ORGANISM="Synedropsis recta cf, Strain CCMP1620" /LENGTH=247 /DNA_ID=CAMNT_0006967299 /DNA_START=57 /DNA_END=800 /DNA_ORIENTATION=-